ncbi:MAG: glutathione peroxidase [Cyclobacteriaceae bacterium]|jgi:glutathione peroxidase|nr:glutathione peroxidase [Flammeovirgaceae bacterium]
MKISLLFFLTTLFMTPTSIYDFKIQSIDGKEIDFVQYKDKTLLIVNTASECGYTPQYADLQELHEKFGNQITILGFPANNFGGQEPGTNVQIASFCKKNYGVTFQMFEKISVKGSDQHPLYQFLKEKSGKEPSWNFCKYLVKPDGTVKFFASGVNPGDDDILKELK